MALAAIPAAKARPARELGPAAARTIPVAILVSELMVVPAAIKGMEMTRTARVSAAVSAASAVLVRASLLVGLISAAATTLMAVTAPTVAAAATLAAEHPMWIRQLGYQSHLLYR